MAIVSLSSTTRSNLLALTKTTSLVERTQERLSTGLEIASPEDNAQKYFQAKSLDQRAKSMNDSKSSIRQGISTLETALIGFNSVEKLLSQIKGTLDSSRSQTQVERAETETQIRELAQQIQKAVDDSSYQGLNLLNTSSSKLTVRFSEKIDSNLSVSGEDLGLTALWNVPDEYGDVALYGQLRTDMGFFGPAGWNVEGSLGAYLSTADFTDPEELARYNNMVDYIQNILDEVISNIRAKASNIATNVAILNVRSDFTQEYVNTLDSGSAKLTVANLNQEGASLLALQTRQQLSVQSLSIAGQSEQAILGIFRG